MKRNFFALPLLLATSLAQALPGLDPLSEITLPEAASAMVLADVDHDTAFDFIVADAANNASTIYYGAGDGSIDEARTPLSINIDAAFHVLATGDFNNDGWMDIAGVQATDDAIVTWLNAGDGLGGRTFVEGVTLTAGSGIEAIIAGDLDGIAGDDLVVANANDDSVHVFLNNAGTFDAGTEIASGDFPVALALLDVEDDTDNDLLVLNAVDGTLQVFLNAAGTMSSGSTTQAASIASGAGQAFPLAMAVVSVGADPHVVIANLVANEIYSLKADGSGGFDSGSVIASDWHGTPHELSADTTLTDPDAAITFSIDGVVRLPQVLAVGDITGDGHLDVVANAIGRDALLVFPGNGVDGFDAMQLFAAGGGLRSIVVAALDADGYADAAGLAGETVRTLVNQNLPNRAPVAFRRSIVLDECTSQELTMAYDVDGDDLEFGELSLNSDHPIAMEVALPVLEITANDTGGAVSLDVATFQFTMYDGVAFSEVATIDVVAKGNGAPGECEIGTGLEISGEIFAADDLTIVSAGTITGSTITIVVNGVIDLATGGTAVGGGSGSGGSVTISDGSISFDTLTGSGSITVSDGAITIGGDTGVIIPGSIVVVDDGGTVTVENPSESPGNEEEPAGDNDEGVPDDGNVDDSDNDGDGDETTDGETAGGGGNQPGESASDAPTSGGGAWTWLLLPLLFIRRRRS